MLENTFCFIPGSWAIVKFSLEGFFHATSRNPVMNLQTLPALIIKTLKEPKEDKKRMITK